MLPKKRWQALSSQPTWSHVTSHSISSLLRQATQSPPFDAAPTLRYKLKGRMRSYKAFTRRAGMMAMQDILKDGDLVLWLFRQYK